MASAFRLPCRVVGSWRALPGDGPNCWDTPCWEFRSPQIATMTYHSSIPIASPQSSCIAPYRKSDSILLFDSSAEIERFLPSRPLSLLSLSPPSHARLSIAFSLSLLDSTDRPQYKVFHPGHPNLADRLSALSSSTVRLVKHAVPPLGFLLLDQKRAVASLGIAQ